MVIGARRGTAGSPLWRKPGKKLLGWIANHLTGSESPDLNSGLRAVVAHDLPILSPAGQQYDVVSVGDPSTAHDVAHVITTLLTQCDRLHDSSGLYTSREYFELGGGKL